MNNLVIIGNGFDLAHDMKTSYNHFIEDLINKLCANNTLNDNITKEIYARKYDDLINHIRQNGYQRYQFKNHFIGLLLESMSTLNWCDIESAYFELLKEIGTNQASYRSPESLNSQFEFVRNNLGKYLCDQEVNIKAIDSYKKMFSLFDSAETTILTFNYTNTLRTLYSNEIRGSKIIHIHGELVNSRNPMIFGYAATDEQSRELIDKEDNEYMRYIKKHLYKRTENEKTLIGYLEETKNIDVTILGHSCGISDKLILNQILNHGNVKSINIFYHEVYDHYFQTQVNIDRIMNNDDNFSKLVDFNSSHRMPQHNDTEEQQKQFTDYISQIQSHRDMQKQETRSRRSLNVF